MKFAVLLADEAQKVKTPGARVTDAIKGMNADFRIALTERRSRTGWRISGASSTAYIPAGLAI